MKKKFGMTTGLLMIVVLLVSMAIGATGAKYVSQEQTAGQVTITADIGTIVLQEHEAVRRTDGSYELTAVITDSNEYYLIPGLDIPKDPHVVITKPDALPVYVYVEVDTNIPASSAVVYQLADCWELVSGTTDVYVYSDNNGPIAVTSSIDRLDILTKPEGSLHEICVGQELNLSGEVNLTFHAYMYQAIAGKSADEVYQEFHK